MRIIFLDYDGVVNTLCFQDVNESPNFNFPEDNKVNNTQAIGWLNRLCKETGAKIVVTSTWRKYKNYKECLYNAGLNKEIEIIDNTDDKGYTRIAEIRRWLALHPEVKSYVILDDDFIEKDNKHWIKTETYIGITCSIYEMAKNVLMQNL